MSDPNSPGNNWQNVPATPPEGTAAPDPVPAAPPPSYVQPPQPGSYPPPGQPYQAPPPQYGVPQSAGMDSTTAATVAYITFIPAIIFLFVEPYRRDAFVRFHSFQCIGLTVVWVAVRILLGFIAVALHMWLLTGLISAIIGLCFFVLWIVCMVKAKGGQWFKVPFIGDFALAQSRKP